MVEGGQVSNRIIDRNYGIWSNNADIHGPLGIVSTDDAAFITWQDSRNGQNLGSADDTYFASVLFRERSLGVGAAGDDDEGIPTPVLIGAGIAVGMGAVMLVVFAVTRRKPAAAA